LQNETFGAMAGVAANPDADPEVVRNLPLLHAALALLALVMATMLAVYKPRGMTRYGRRQQHRQRPSMGDLLVSIDDRSAFLD
jgi:hypothetical protein